MVDHAGEFVPKIVTEWINKIQEATGYGSTVQRLNVRTWRLTTEGNRVRLTTERSGGTAQPLR